MAPAAPNESLPGVPSNIERRQLADEDTGTTNIDPEATRARNIRAYHRSQIAEAQKVIATHQAIVDDQNAILGEEEGDGDVDTDTLPNGTDIAARFQNAFDSIYTVDELKDELAANDVDTSGDKPELIERLVALHNGELEDEDNNNSSDNSDDNSQE